MIKIEKSTERFMFKTNKQPKKEYYKYSKILTQELLRVYMKQTSYMFFSWCALDKAAISPGIVIIVMFSGFMLF